MARKTIILSGNKCYTAKTTKTASMAWPVVKNYSFFADMTLEKKEEQKQTNPEQLNMKGVYLHVLGDALGSVVVLMSALTIYFAEVSLG